MNEQLQMAMIELIKKANGGIDTSINFLSNEIPDVVMQVLLWHGVKSAIWFVFFFACSVIAIRSAIKYKPADAIAELDAAYDCGESWTRFSRGSQLTSTKFDNAKEFAYPKFWILCSFSIISCMATVINIDWLKILIAPKLYLIEYAAALVK